MVGSKTKSFYQILNVKPDSNLKEIKSKYYKLCKSLHPDTNLAKNNNYAEELNDVMRAYAVLKDPKKRHEYDQSLSFEMEKNQLCPSDFEFRAKMAQKPLDETVKFGSKVSRIENNSDNSTISERIEEIRVFRTRFIVLGAIAIGYWISSIMGD